MMGECNDLLEQLPALRLKLRGTVEGYLAREAVIVNFVLYRAERYATGVT